MRGRSRIIRREPLKDEFEPLNSAALSRKEAASARRPCPKPAKEQLTAGTPDFSCLRLPVGRAHFKAFVADGNIRVNSCTSSGLFCSLHWPCSYSAAFQRSCVSAHRYHFYEQANPRCKTSCQLFNPTPLPMPICRSPLYALRRIQSLIRFAAAMFSRPRGSLQQGAGPSAG